MLACHAHWLSEGEGSLVVWAEEADAAGAAHAMQNGGTPHPFAASTASLSAALGAGGGATVAAAVASARAELAEVRLPGTGGVPQASPQLTGAAEVRRRRGRTGWLACRVPALRLRPGPALDVLDGLTGAQPAGLLVGDSVVALGRVASLALEAVAAGRVVPVLERAGRRFSARWSPIGAGRDAERLSALAAALPPACLAGDATVPAEDLVPHAFGAFVDALCREALGPGGALPRSTRQTTGALGAWLEALGKGESVVRGHPRELATLARDLATFRSPLSGGAASWRLCFRLLEPAHDDGEPDAADGPWRVELLLQAVDDPSLLVAAAEVWRAGETLRRAARTLEAPHEVLLAELGRALHAFPELSAVLETAAPTVLETDAAGAHRFLSESAPVLEMAGFGVLLPSWWGRPAARLGLRARTAPKSRSAAAGRLGEAGLAEFDWEAALGDESLGLAELRRLAALKAPLVRVRGQWVEVRSEEIERLLHFFESGRRPTRPPTAAELLAALAGTAPLTADVPLVGVVGEGALASLLAGRLPERLEAAPTPRGFRGELRPYQRLGLAWVALLEEMGLGACLADDMGLGKTATVLGVLQRERARRGRPPGPTLVVCPTSVIGNWKAEVERFTPGLRAVVHHGVARAREEALAAEVAGADLVITSYPLVERDRAALGSIAWHRLVLDEAQQVKNPAAKQTRAVRSLDAARRLALTGTPVENHLGDLWSIMDILNPGLLGNERSFRERFAVPIERYGEEDVAEALRTLTRPVVLRRLKTDPAIAPDLPTKIEMKEHCTLTREQATLYQAVVDEMLERIASTEGIERRGLVLSTMLRLKQVCNHPAQYLADGSALAGRSGKLERTVELLEAVREAGERALVFTQFAEMGTLLQAHLRQELGCRVAFLHGGVPRARRDEMVAEFQADAGAVPVMVLSLKAGGTGLNLTAANHVVHYDRWWNPAVENQATDRAYRIGQRRDVQVRTLVCAGTVEDRIDEMLEHKRELAERVVGTGESWLTELSNEELAEVFRLSAEVVA